MATSPWKHIEIVTPPFDTELWVRRICVMAAFKATLSSATGEWQTPSGFTYPFWIIDSWRPL